MRILGASLRLLLLLVAGSALAQDAVEVSPEHYTVVFENERLRVLEVRYQPGDISEFHEHPENLFVALKAGEADGLNEDGTVSKFRFEVGDVVWREAQAHRGSNASDEEMHLILIEFKESD